MRRAAGLVIVQDHRILMVTRRSGLIAIPGGKGEEGELSIDTAIRETFEETGLVCRVPEPHQAFHANDVDSFAFSTWRGKIVAGDLRRSSEGIPFWLDLNCFLRTPNVLQYPEWSRTAIRFFNL